MVDQFGCNAGRVRPVIRWKSFWFGFLVLGFLGWAWAGSMGRGSYLSPVEGRVVFSNNGGQIGFNLSPEGWDDRMGIAHTLVQAETAFSEFVDSLNHEESGRFYVVAHWFLMLLFFLRWSAIHAWRWQRQRN